MIDRIIDDRLDRIIDASQLHQQAIDEFCSFTGAKMGEAKTFLETYGWNLEAAVEARHCRAVSSPSSPRRRRVLQMKAVHISNEISPHFTWNQSIFQ